MDVACQASLSIGFSRQEYWNGLPFPSPEDLPDPGIEPRLLHCRQNLYRLSYQGIGLEICINVTVSVFHTIILFLQPRFFFFSPQDFLKCGPFF